MKKILLLALLPFYVFGQKTSVDAYIQTQIPDNTQQLIKPVNIRNVTKRLNAEGLNLKDGGNVIESLTGYKTQLTPSDNKHFTTKKYVDDAITGVSGDYYYKFQIDSLLYLKANKTYVDSNLTSLSRFYIPFSGTSTGHYITGNIFSKGITSFGHYDTINVSNTAYLTAYGNQGDTIKFVQATAQLGDSGSSFRVYTTPNDIQASVSVFRSVSGDEVRKDFVVSKDSTSFINGDVLIYKNTHGFVNTKISADSRALIPRWYFDSLNTGGGGGTTTNAVTFNNGGSGDASGTTFNGSAAKTISYNTIGAQPTLVSGTNIKTVNGTTLLGSGNLAVGDALVANPLSQFASTTSSQLRGVLSDETGTGAAYFQGGDIGTPSAAVLTNATGLPLTTGVTGILPIANGGTGTATPSLVAGTGVSITGSFPNQTINAGALTPVGSLFSISGSQWNTASGNFTKVGTAGGTFTYGATTLTVANSANNLTEYITYDTYGSTNYEKWKISGRITVGTITSSSGGIWFGTQSTQTTGPASIQCAILLGTGNSGALAFYYNNSLTNARVSTSRMTISSSDVIDYVVMRNKNVYTISIIGVTNPQFGNTFSTTVDVSYPTQDFANSNSGKFSIGAFGDTHVLNSFTVSSDMPVNPDWIFSGDSYTFGASNTSIDQRYPDLIGARINGIVAVHAQSGNRTNDMNPSELIAMKGTNTKLVIVLGTNNIGLGGQSAATAKADLDSKIATLVSGGYVVGTSLFVALVLPNNTNNMDTYNALVNTTYSTSGAVWDMNRVLRNASGTGINSALSVADGTHPNIQGSQQIAASFISRFNSLLTLKPNPTISVPVYNNPRNLAVGYGIRTYTPFTSFDAVDVSGAAPIRFGKTLLDAEGYLGTTNDYIAYIGAGGNYNGSAWIAKHATPTLGVFGLGFALYSDAGKTPGSSYTPSKIFEVNASGDISNTGNLINSSTLSAIYRATNGATDLIAKAIIDPANSLTSGTAWGFSASHGFFCTVANGTRRILGAGISAANVVTTAGSEVVNLSINAKPAGSGFQPAVIVTGDKRVFIGGTTVPTATLHLAAGTATASTAPLKFTSGTNLTTPEAGAVEFDGTNFFGTASTTRYTFAKTLTNTATLDFGSTSAQNSADLTITVTGAAVGDAVIIGADNASVLTNSSYSAYVSATNTVTVRFNNYSSGSQDPASGTFRVSVIKY